MDFILHRKFEKQFVKLDAKTRGQFIIRRDILILNPFNPILNNHSLSGEYAGCRSINITGDYRAIFYSINDETIVFISIGTHHELFGL